MQSLKFKTIILLSVLIVIITTVMTLLFVQNINKLVDSNIKLFSTTLTSNEKKELKNKIDLASNVISMYYQQTKPKFVERTVKGILISHQQQLFSQLTHFYKINKNRYSTKDLKEKLKLLVQYARYGASGYFWINNMNYKMIMHPIKPEYDGKYFVNTPDVPFVVLGVDSLKKSKNGEAFIRYRFYNPATKKYEFKVSMVKIFKPYGWIIGTGQYLSDITPMIKKQALNDIRALRYGNNGYFWINDIDYRMVMHPIRPEYDGKVFLNTKKVPFVQLGVNALKKSKKDTAIIRYRFYNPATKKYDKKLSIVKLFKPWGWIIGTGVYLDTVDSAVTKVKLLKDKEEKSFIYRIVALAIFVIFVTILIAYYLIMNFIVNPVKDLNNEKNHFEEISNIDYLTNVLNRRSFFEHLDSCFVHARNNGATVSIMMIDIDYFKAINDTCGHEAGDVVLKGLPKLIKRCIRENDIFGRLGGEEFAICILNVDSSVIYKIAQKIRETIKNSEIDYDGVKIKYTVSIGIHEVKPCSETPVYALSRADKALYFAKNSGRDRVEIYNETTCLKQG